jgi:hypothetical protein
MQTALYPEEFVNGLPGFAEGKRNPWVVAVCRRPERAIAELRERMEGTWRHIPRGAREQFAARLRHTKDATFVPALYELFFWGRFLGRGWKVGYEPRVQGSGKHPDFCIETGKGRFYVEVKTVFDSEVEARQEACKDRLEALLRKRLRRPGFCYWVEYQGPLDSEVDCEGIARSIEQWLGGLEGTPGQLYELPINKGRFCGAFVGSFVEDGQPSALFGRANRVAESDVSRMRRALDQKAKDHLSLRAPLVVAICDGHSHGRDSLRGFWKDVGEAALGTEVWVLRRRAEGQGWDVHLRHKPDGVGTMRRSSGECVRPGLSAVAGCRLGWEDDEVLFKVKVWHNPLAELTLERSLFSDWPQFVVSRTLADAFEMRWTNEQEVAIPLWDGRAQ